MDSATVHGWLRSIITRSHCVKTAGVAETLVKRWLALIGELCDEYGLDITIELVKSAVNKGRCSDLSSANLTKRRAPDFECGELRKCHHFGVCKTLYLAQQVDPKVTHDQVGSVDRAYQECVFIDSAPTH